MTRKKGRNSKASAAQEQVGGEDADFTELDGEVVGCVSRHTTVRMPGPAPGHANGPVSGLTSGPVSGPVHGPVPGPAPGRANGLVPGPAHGPVHGLTDGPVPGSSNRPAHGPAPVPVPGRASGPVSGPVHGPVHGPTDRHMSGRSNRAVHGCTNGLVSERTNMPEDAREHGFEEEPMRGQVSGHKRGPVFGHSTCHVHGRTYRQFTDLMDGVAEEPVRGQVNERTHGGAVELVHRRWYGHVDSVSKENARGQVDGAAGGAVHGSVSRRTNGHGDGRMHGLTEGHVGGSVHDYKHGGAVGGDVHDSVSRHTHAPVHGRMQSIAKADMSAPHAHVNNLMHWLVAKTARGQVEDHAQIGAEEGMCAQVDKMMHTVVKENVCGHVNEMLSGVVETLLAPAQSVASAAAASFPAAPSPTAAPAAAAPAPAPAPAPAAAAAAAAVAACEHVDDHRHGAAEDGVVLHEDEIIPGGVEETVCWHVNQMLHGAVEELLAPAESAVSAPAAAAAAAAASAACGQVDAHSQRGAEERMRGQVHGVGNRRLPDFMSNKRGKGPEQPDLPSRLKHPKRTRENPDHMRESPDHMHAHPDHIRDNPNHMHENPDHMREHPNHMHEDPDHMHEHLARMQSWLNRPADVHDQQEGVPLPGLMHNDHTETTHEQEDEVMPLPHTVHLGQEEEIPVSRTTHEQHEGVPLPHTMRPYPPLLALRNPGLNHLPTTFQPPANHLPRPFEEDVAQGVVQALEGSPRSHAHALATGHSAGQWESSAHSVNSPNSSPERAFVHSESSHSAGQFDRTLLPSQTGEFADRLSPIWVLHGVNHQSPPSFVGALNMSQSGNFNNTFSLSPAASLPGVDHLITSRHQLRAGSFKQRRRHWVRPYLPWNQPLTCLACLLPLLLVTATPVRQHWFRILDSQRAMNNFTDTLEMPVPTDVGMNVSHAHAAASAASMVRHAARGGRHAGASASEAETNTAALDGDERHCRSVFYAAMAGHNQLLGLSKRAQNALSRSFITHCTPSYVKGDQLSQFETSFGSEVALRMWQALNPHCWPFLEYNPMKILWDSLCNVGHCLLMFLVTAVAATIFPNAVPLNLLVLQLDILICIYCYQVKETTDSLRLAVNQIVSADEGLSTWDWPSSLSLAVYRGLLHQTLSNLDDTWEDTHLILELPWMPLLGRMELSPEAMMQLSLTSAAACSMNLVAVIRPELSIYAMCKNSFSFMVGSLTTGVVGGGGGGGKKSTLARNSSEAAEMLEILREQQGDVMKMSLLCDRLGGHSGIEAAVEQLLSRVTLDVRLGHFFQTVNRTFLRMKLTMFLSAALAGPVAYDTQALRDLHMGMIVGMGLNTSHFDAFSGHLIGVLADQGARAGDQAEVMLQLANLRSSFLPASDLDTLLYSWHSMGVQVVEMVVKEALANMGMEEAFLQSQQSALSESSVQAPRNLSRGLSLVDTLWRYSLSSRPNLATVVDEVAGPRLNSITAINEGEAGSPRGSSCPDLPNASISRGPGPSSRSRFRRVSTMDAAGHQPSHTSESNRAQAGDLAAVLLLRQHLQHALDTEGTCQHLSSLLHDLLRMRQLSTTVADGGPAGTERWLHAAKRLKVYAVSRCVFDHLTCCSLPVFVNLYNERGQRLHAACVAALEPLRKMLDFALPL